MGTKLRKAGRQDLFIHRIFIVLSDEFLDAGPGFR
jgi:hypothetical protein